MQRLGFWAARGLAGGTAPTITADSPPGGTVGVPYSYQFAATGSPTPTWAVTSGAIPAGLTLEASGLLHGTPTTVAAYAFVVTASNGVNPTAVSPTLNVNIAAASITVVQEVPLFNPTPPGTANPLVSGAGGVLPIAATVAGNQLVIAVVGAAGFPTVTSITDSAGNTWAAVKNQGPSNFVTTGIWQTTNAAPASITSVTINWTGAVTPAADFFELSGAVNAQDGTNGVNLAGTAASTGAVAPVASGDFILAAVGWDEVAGGTANPDTGGAFTIGAPDGTRFISVFSAGTTFIKLRTAWKTLSGVPAAQTYTTTLPAFNAGATAIGLIK